MLQDYFFIWIKVLWHIPHTSWPPFQRIGKPVSQNIFAKSLTRWQNVKIYLERVSLGGALAPSSSSSPPWPGRWSRWRRWRRGGKMSKDICKEFHQVAPLPPRLHCRHLDLGDVSPALTERFIQCLQQVKVKFFLPLISMVGCGWDPNRLWRWALPDMEQPTSWMVRGLCA